MTDREQAIKDLEDIIATAEGIEGLSEDAGIIIGINKIDSLKFALESVKVDRAYDLAYEKVDFIEIPEKVTNGEMIKALFPNCKAERTESGLWVNVQNLDGDSMFSAYWWDSPYRKE